MSKRDWRILLEDILDGIDQIEAYIKDLNFEAFAKARIRIDAVVRNLEIIGEAARVMPEGMKAKHPEVAWKKIVGLRNRIIHEYFDVDLEIVWFIIEEELPLLKSQLSAIGD